MAVYISDNDGQLIKVSGLQKLPDTIENVEVVYDMDNPNKDWGYSGGLNNIIVNNKDFSKYKRLKIFCSIKNSTTTGTDSFGRNIVFEIDLSKNFGFNYSASYRGMYLTTATYNAGIVVEISMEKDAINIRSYDNDSVLGSGGVYKIEGVY